MNNGKRKLRRGEHGQAAVFLVLALGIFLIGGVGFVVDGANLWFHHQSSQTAADAACDAAAMDMLSVAASVSPQPSWIPASSDNSSFNCIGVSASFPPCRYAAFNGFSGSGSQNIQVSFPRNSNLPKGFSPPPDCPDAPPYTPTGCSADILDNGLAPTPYVKVDLTENVPTTFMQLVGAPRTTPVPSHSLCGLTNVLSPVPILVLNPNAPNGFDMNGLRVVNALKNSGNLIVSGAQKSVQVNSTTNDAVEVPGATTLDDVAGDGGGALAVAGRESAQPLASGKWVSAAGLMSDPFAMINVSNQPLALPPDYGTTVCPGLPAGTHCDYYHPGFYPAATCPPPSLGSQAAICVGPHLVNSQQIGLAVFEPGIYYLGEDFFAGQNSCVRPATGFSDGGGSIFYLFGKAVLNVTSDSGTLTSGSFSCTSTPVSIADATCPGGNLNLPVSVTGFTGNVLLAPCSGPYGDPLGNGKVRGMLFFQDRNLDVPPHPALWSGSSSFALVGNLYIHNCHLVASGDNGANCDPNAFQETLYLGSNGYIVGGIVVDQLNITSGANIKVFLNPNPQYYVLKASLLQ